MIALVPEWENPPRWLGRPIDCRYCGRPIRLLKDSSGHRHIVEAAPSSRGWLRVWLHSKTITWAPGPISEGVASGRPYLSFVQHPCPGRPRPSPKPSPDRRPAPPFEVSGFSS